VRAAIFQGPRDIGVGDRPDPRIEHPTDAIVTDVLACVCGSDLWYYRDTGHGLEYLCADAYAQLRDPERLPWQLVPDDAM